MARLLVVDADAAGRAALEGALRRAGHAVASAASGREAAGRVAAGGVDAVVLGRSERGGLAALLDACEARAVSVLAGALGTPGLADAGQRAQDLAAVVAAARAVVSQPWPAA